MTTNFQPLTNSSNPVDYDNYTSLRDSKRYDMTTRALDSYSDYDVTDFPTYTSVDPTSAANVSRNFNPTEWYHFYDDSTDVYENYFVYEEQDEISNPVGSTLSSFLTSLNNITTDGFNYYNEIFTNSTDYINTELFSNISQPTMALVSNASLIVNSTLSSLNFTSTISSVPDFDDPSRLPSSSSALASLLWTSASVMASASSSMESMAERDPAVQNSYEQ